MLNNTKCSLPACALNPTGRAASRQAPNPTSNTQNTAHHNHNTAIISPITHPAYLLPSQTTNNKQIIGGSQTNNSAERAPIPINTGVLN